MSIFPTKILLATDASEEATLAAQTAVDLADKTGVGGQLVVVSEEALRLGVILEGVQENGLPHATQPPDDHALLRLAAS